MPQGSYVWNAPESPFAIHLSVDVIKRLGLGALEAFKAVPRRGLEIGGILRGRTETQDGFTTLYIDGFERVESEHRSGPSYVLSESDLERLDKAVKQHPDTVGIYRTQTRSEVLTLEEEDIQIFRRCFTTPDGVFLLIHPASAAAAFFLAREGNLMLAHEFPFHAGELSAAAAGGSGPTSEIAAAPPRPDAPETDPFVFFPEPPPGRTRRGSRKPTRMLPLAVGVLAAIAGTTMLARFRHSPPPPPAIPAAPDWVPLSIQRQGRGLQLSWDRNSPAVRQATRATLYIDDGKHNSHLDLEPRELNVGAVSYWPETQEVRFRLDVVSAAGTTSGAIRVLGGELAPEPVSTPVPAATPKKTVPIENPVRVANARPRSASGLARSVAAREEVPAQKPSPFRAPEPPPKAVAAPPATPQAISPTTAVSPKPAAKPEEDVKSAASSVSAPVARPGPAVPEPYVSVVAEPVTGSFLGRMVRRIPLVRRLKKQPQAFVPPQALHVVRPVLTPQERHSLTDDVPIDVRVFVTDSGKVDYAELLSTAKASNRSLAAAAVYAARRWNFTPARIGDENVPGEVILHFEFRSPSSDDR